jgi:predicted MFS family arabinose efflux permease
MLPAIRGHLTSAVHEQDNLGHFKEVLSHPNHVRSYVFMVVLTFAGFLIIPFISPYMVANVGVSERDLTYIYLVGGAFTFFSSRWVGKISDRFGKLRVYTIAAILSNLPVLMLTYLPAVPLALALCVTSAFMVLMNARFVPAMAMMTASVEARNRGSFMSISASLQQMSSGLGAFAAGLIVTKSAEGPLVHYGWAGWLATAVTLASLAVAARVRPIHESTPGIH